MEKENQNKNQDNSNWGIVVFILFLIALVAGLFHKLFPKHTKTRTYPKSDLAKLYNVDIKTVNKWVEVFCDPNKLPYDTYKRKRKLPEDMYHYVVDCLGLPTEETPVMSKMQIIGDGDSISSGEYRAVRNTLKLSPNKDIISLDAYHMFNVFPPKIAQLIHKKVA